MASTVIDTVIDVNISSGEGIKSAVLLRRLHCPFLVPMHTGFLIVYCLTKCAFLFVWDTPPKVDSCSQFYLVPAFRFQLLSLIYPISSSLSKAPRRIYIGGLVGVISSLLSLTHGPLYISYDAWSCFIFIYSTWSDLCELPLVQQNCHSILNGLPIQTKELEISNFMKTIHTLCSSAEFNAIF